jgi:SAM-dependent methyltransferase
MDAIMNCGACDSPCSGSKVHVQSVMDNSMGVFGVCEGCGSLRVLDKIDYSKLYLTRDSSNYPNAENKVLVKLKQWYLRKIAKTLLLSVAKPSAKILDYGCGGGEFANAMNSLSLASIYACDMQADRPQTLNQKIKYSATDGVAKTSPYDIIVMRHVLEHIEHPQLAIKEVMQYLVPGGKLLIEVPNSNSLFRSLLGNKWPGYFFPFHIHVFSERGLRQLAEHCGMRVSSVALCDTPILGVFFMGFGVPRTFARILSMLLYPVQRLLNQLTNRQEAIRITLEK